MSAPTAERLSYLSDPDDPHYIAAMRVTCEACGAKPGRPCWNIIDANEPLPNRLIHHARLERRTAA